MIIRAKNRYTKSWIAATLVTVAAAVLSACTVVGTGEMKLGELAACRSNLGAYYLPKHYVTMAVRRKSVDGGYAYELAHFNTREFDLAAEPAVKKEDERRYVRVDARADTRHGYCLDYLASRVSDDALIVNRTEHGLLSDVATKGKFYNSLQPGGGGFEDDATEDQSLKIAKKVARGVFVGLSGQPLQCSSPDDKEIGGTKFKEYCTACDSNPRSKSCRKFHLARDFSKSRGDDPNDIRNRGDFREAFDADKAKREEALRAAASDPLTDDGRLAFNIDFEPTKPMDAALVNNALKSYGFCAILDDGHVELNDYERYCSDPYSYARQRGWDKDQGYDRFASAGARETTATHKPRNFEGGVLYRPTISYTLHIFQRNFGRWQLYNQDRVRLANVAPIVSIGVDRSVFAKRNTVLKFADGSLKAVNVEKESEIAGAVQIPLAIVQNIARLPSQIIQVRIDSTTSATELIKVNEQLIQTHVGYIEAEKAMKEARQKVLIAEGATSVDPQRRSKLINQCALILKRDNPGNANPQQTCFDIVTIKHGRP